MLSIALKGKKAKRGPALWDTKQFACGQYFSQTAYFKVLEIEGNSILV